MRLMQNIPTQQHNEEFFKLIQQSYISKDAYQQCIKICEEDKSLLNCHNPAGWRPIDQAAFYGCMHIVAYLLNQGVNPNEPNVFCSGQCPVHFAAMGGEIQTLIYLIAHGASPESRDYASHDLIHFAQESYEQSCVDFCKSKKEIKKASVRYLLSEISKEWSYPYDDLLYWQALPYSKAIYRELCHSATFMRMDVSISVFKKAIRLDVNGKPNTILSRLFQQKPELANKIKQRIENLNSPMPLPNNAKQLPYELWLMIISLFDTPTLLNLTLVSRFFAYMVSEIFQKSLQKKWLTQSQEFYPLSLGSLRYIDSLFSDKYLKTLVPLEHHREHQSGFYPDGIQPFINNHDDPNIWYVLADNINAFKQNCVLLPIGQQQTYIPLALAKGRKRIVEYLLNLKPRLNSFGGNNLFSVNRADHSTACPFYLVTLMRFFECAIISREVAMLDAVLAIKGANFSCIPNYYITYAIASGSILMVDRLLSMNNFEITKEDISAAINSRQCAMFDKVTKHYHEPINQIDISLWKEQARLSCGAESVMSKHVVETYEQLQNQRVLGELRNKY